MIILNLRVRKFDKNFIKRFLLRDKPKSKDEKLLNTFQKINELNLNRMAENPELIVTTKKNPAKKELVFVN